MNRLDTTISGGFRTTQKTWEFMQDNFLTALAAIAKLCGDKTILWGVEVTGPSVSDGWISYNGELLYFEAGGTDTDVVISETGDTVTYEDLNTRTQYLVKTAKCGTGVTTFPFADLVRLNKLKEMWLAGDVKMVDCDGTYIAANFDGTGLGTNERLGWAICNGSNGTKDRRGLFSVAYDNRTVDPSNSIWDASYHTLGNVGGEKKHALTTSEMPAHTHTLPATSIGGGGSGGPPYPAGADTTVTTSSTGGSTPHENRPPFIVTLYIQKV